MDSTNHRTDLHECVSAEETVSAEVSDIYDIFGEPEILPRVGDEYQVDIPSVIAESDYLKLSMNPCEEENTFGSFDFLVGLPIPVMWISEEAKSQEHEQDEACRTVDICKKDESLKSKCTSEAEIFSESNGFKPEVDPVDVSSDHGTKLGESEDLALQEEMLIKVQEHGRKGYCPVPGLWGNSWDSVEEGSFLLGLYIFGKNLSQVKKFIGSKQMGDTLSYYYGRFYRSDRYYRWSECCKLRRRRYIYGQKIFTGLRQQELLSRLLPHVSEECQNTLLEISKTFGEGKMSLEEYVFSLKDAVGLNAFVEGVGIGKGKQDLTGMAVETLKSNQVVSVRPEIPIGKACSTLTTLEIVNFLKGDFRLSKARSSDLFWEAVWPRLLARGWHSEQPNNKGFVAGSKHYLVFLIPGIRKFSRRKLVKGNHYFDSVSDVLSKVASDPDLLEIEGCKSKEENGWTDETKLDKEDFPDQQRHCYLKPRTPNRSTDVMKFTVVDTSLAIGTAFKVRELRSLPVEIMNTSTNRSHSEDDDGDSSDDSTDESSSSDTLSDKDEPNDLKAKETNSGKIVSPGGKDFENDSSNKGFPVNVPDLTNKPAKIPKDKDSDACNDTQPKKALKCQLSRKMRPEDRNHLAPPATKRPRRKPPCGRKDTSCSTTNTRLGPSLVQEASCCAYNSDFSENVFSQVDPSQEKLSSTSSSRGVSPIASGENLRSISNHMDAEHPQEKPQPRTLFDLNVPVSSDVEADEAFTTNVTERHNDRMSNEPAFTTNVTERHNDQMSNEPANSSNAVNTSKSVAHPEQEPNINSRRQSTRNRPLTTKVLEAFACGFLDTKQKQKRKSKDAFPQGKLNSRRSRARVGTPESINSSPVDLSLEENGTAINNNNGDILSKIGISSQIG